MKRLFYFLFFLPLLCQAQTIHTIAGWGTILGDGKSDL